MGDVRAFTIKLSDILKCPDQRMDVGHYRDDGTCLHREWCVDCGQEIGGPWAKPNTISGWDDDVVCDHCAWVRVRDHQQALEDAEVARLERRAEGTES